MTDDALIKAMALAMFEYGLATREERAKAALAVARPIIEAPLRAENEKLRADKAAWQGVQQGTADVVKQLEEDNKKLRAALKPFAEAADIYNLNDFLPSIDEEYTSFQIGLCRAAADALKETGDE